MTETGDTPVIEMDNVSFSYGETPVLKQVSLRVMAGDFLGVVGPNAGGKSTLLKLVLGLLEPRSGRIRVLGKSPRRAARRVGYVPQHPGFARDFPISVEQVALLGRLGVVKKPSWRERWLPGRYSDADRQAARAALREVEAADLANRQIGSLSGGQLQRVLLARALAGEPEILILDEPTANIDQRLESDIFDLLKQLNRRLTIVVVSHDIAFISSYVNRVACVNRTLVCHQTESIDAEAIHALYGDNVRRVAHSHG